MEISIRRVSKDFDGLAALDKVDLDIASGELLALLGPSGSGKTTLLRVIAGLDMASAGRVLFGGRDATGLSVQERHVGFVFQHYALFRHMTVFDNIAYGLQVRPHKTRPSSSEIGKRVNDLLELVQLAQYGKRFPAQLSGGQRQRVALARALAIEPQVLLLDEPFGALDAQVRKELRRWLRDIHTRTGQTMIFVTHDQDEAMELADRVAIFNKGRVEQVGQPGEIHARPASSFIASFIGNASAVDAAVRGGRACIGTHMIGDAPGMPDGAAKLYLRPGEAEIGVIGNGLPAQVLSVRWSTGGRLAAMQMEGVDLPVEVTLPETMDVQPGQRVGLKFPVIRIFPA